MAKKTTHKNTSKTILALTVGGAPRPLALSIAANRPDQVIFFASASSSKSITARGQAPAEKGDRDTRGVLQSLEELKCPLKESRFEIIIVPEQNLYKCVEIIRERLMGAVAEVGEDGLLLDFTGGTKLMSAALALAGDRLPAQYCYVAAREGSKSRDKEGLGVTVDGKEHLLTLTNPRNVMAHGVIEDAMTLMRLGSWAAATQLLEAQRHRITDMAPRREIEAWKHLAETYMHWDNLAHKNALRSLDSTLQTRSFDRLSRHLNPKKADALRNHLEKNKQRLEEIIEEKDATALCRDLLANACRRAEEKKFDEAVIRLYRAIEYFASDLLSRKYGIETSNADFEKLPPAYIERNGIRPPGKGRRIELALQRSYEVLGDLGDPHADRFGELGLDSKGLLAARNNSVLVHGTRPVATREWSGLRYAAFTLLRVKENTLVKFPEL